MKRIAIFLILIVAIATESSAQERIDALLGRDISGGTTTYRMAVKRDETTGEIIKRVAELTATNDKALAKDFREAFEAERAKADVWEENKYSTVYQVTAVWLNPKRIYTITITGNTVVVYAQTIYQSSEEEQE